MCLYTAIDLKHILYELLPLIKGSISYENPGVQKKGRKQMKYLVFIAEIKCLLLVMVSTRWVNVDLFTGFP